MSTIVCCTCQTVLNQINPSLPSLQERKWQIDGLARSSSEPCYICKQIWTILRRERPDLELAASTLLQNNKEKRASQGQTPDATHLNGVESEDPKSSPGLLGKIKRRLSAPPRNERLAVWVEYERDTEFGSNRRAEIRLVIRVFLNEQKKIARDAVVRTSVYAVAGDRIDISGEGSWI